MFSINSVNVLVHEALKYLCLFVGPVTIVVKDTMRPVQLNNVFVCHSADFLEAENVTQIFWNVTVQAFVQNGTISKKGKLFSLNELFCVAP